MPSAGGIYPAKRWGFSLSQLVVVCSPDLSPSVHPCPSPAPTASCFRFWLARLPQPFHSLWHISLQRIHYFTSEVALSPGFMARLKNSEPSGLFLSSPQMHIQSPDPNKSPFYRFSLPFLLCLCCPLLQALIHTRLSQTHNRSILPPLQSFTKSFGTSVFEELCMVSIRVNTPMAMH